MVRRALRNKNAMSFFRNRHVVVAALVAPVLAVVAYYAIDLLVGEKPHAALEGASYRLVERPNCRYNSGACELVNGDFELRMEAARQTGSQLSLRLESVFPLDGVLIALVASEDEAAPPQAMRALDPDGTEWALDMQRPDPERDRLRVAASAGGSLWYGDAATTFIVARDDQQP